jgi:hypothetical protein
MEAITLEEAKNLKPGTVVYHRTARNSDHTPQKWRVNGQVQTWKTRPECVSVPLKRGLYTCMHLTEKNLYYFSLNK